MSEVKSLKEKAEEEKEKIEELKTSDPDVYLKSMYTRRKDILSRMAERSKKREEFTKRGSKAAQRRM